MEGVERLSTYTDTLIDRRQPMIELVFKFLSFSPGPFWLILVFAPHNTVAMRIFDCYLFILSGIFAFMTIPLVPELLPIIANPEHATIKGFISSDIGSLGTWNHMILGDLWIGRWFVHDSIRFRVSHYIRFPILITIIFFGPLGLFFYLLYRWIFLRKFELVEA